MTNHSEGLHYVKAKKEVDNKGKQDKNQRSFVRFIDKSIYFVGLFGPVMTIPQLVKIWIEKNAAGVSVISWSAYLFVAIFWVIYGILHKVKPIIVIYCVWILLEFLIVLGTLLYR